MKQTGALFFIILGTIIGAGFATGKEIAVYFASHGLIFIIFSFVGGFLFYYINNLYLNLSRYFPLHNFTDFSKTVFKKSGNAFNFFLNFSYFVICGSMFAGINAISEYILPIDFPILSIITAIITLIVCYKGIKALASANIIIVPIILVVILTVSVIGIVHPTGLISTNNYVLSPIYCVIYVGMNVILSGVFLAMVGKNYSARQNKVASFLSAMMILVVILVVGTCLCVNPGLVGEKLPLVRLGFSISKGVGVLLCVIIWFAIFTSLISTTYTLNNMIIKNPNLVSSAFIIIVGYVLSLFGFDKIVEYLYPIIGIIGIIFTFILIIKINKIKIKLNIYKPHKHKLRKQKKTA